jgi:hypothetical protein
VKRKREERVRLRGRKEAECAPDERTEVQITATSVRVVTSPRSQYLWNVSEIFEFCLLSFFLGYFVCLLFSDIQYGYRCTHTELYTLQILQYSRTWAWGGARGLRCSMACVCSFFHFSLTHVSRQSVVVRRHVTDCHSSHCHKVTVREFCSCTPASRTATPAFP